MTEAGLLEGYIVEELDAVTASDAILRARYDLQVLIRDELFPDEPHQPFSEYLEDVRRVHEWSNPYRLLVWDADRTELIAAGFLSRDYVESNRHLAWVGAEVRPEHRRRGIASELLRRLVIAARQDERTVLGASSTGEGAGMHVLPRRGFEAKQVGRLSRLHTKVIDRPLMQSWVDDAATHAADYDLLAIDDRMPDELVDRWLAVENVINTAPKDDLDMEDFVPNVERFRTYEAEGLAQGYRAWRVVAVHRSTGHWAGYSELLFSPHHPEVVEQGGTAVDPAHRGHGLGRWLKAANVLRLLDERPDAERIETWNAKSNGPMLDINVAMGFEVVRWNTMFQAPIEAVAATLG